MSRHLITFVLLSSLFATAAQATTLYSNLTSMTPSAYFNGGAVNVAGDDKTVMVADELTLPAGMGGLTADSLTFTVNNANSVEVFVRPEVDFFANDGASDGPGTLITSYIFNPVAFFANTITTVYASSRVIPIPANGIIWAGLSFDNDYGTTGTTADQLNNLGQQIFGLPAVGIGTNLFFKASSIAPAGSNPAGTLSALGSQTAGFGWQLTSTVPEPSTGLLVLAATPLLAMFRRRKA